MAELKQQLFLYRGRVMTDIRVKRIYEPPARSDGKRILVDRMWPRGMTREDAHVDAWIKEVAPSNALRRWFGHDPEKWREFKLRYFAELRHNPAVAELKEAMAASKSITLLFAAMRFVIPAYIIYVVYLYWTTPLAPYLQGPR